MKFVFYTPFSILMDPPPNYLFLKRMLREHKLDLQRDNSKVREMYVEYLYSKERMGYKFLAFEKVTLPSVLKNLELNHSAEWWVYISKEMPVVYKDKLSALVCVSHQIKLIEVDCFTDMSQKYTRDYKKLSEDSERLCVLRIDDDDGVYASLLQDIESAAQSRDYPFLYTCPLGRYCKVSPNGDVVLGGHILRTPYPHTVALAGVDVDVRKLGDHTKIQKRNPDLEIVENLEQEDAVLIACDPDHTATLRRF